MTCPTPLCNEGGKLLGKLCVGGFGFGWGAEMDARVSWRARALGRLQSWSGGGV